MSFFLKPTKVKIEINCRFSLDSSTVAAQNIKEKSKDFSSNNLDFKLLLSQPMSHLFIRVHKKVWFGISLNILFLVFTILLTDIRTEKQGPYAISYGLMVVIRLQNPIISEYFIISKLHQSSFTSIWFINYHLLIAFLFWSLRDSSRIVNYEQLFRLFWFMSSFSIKITFRSFSTTRLFILHSRSQ